MVVDTCTGAVSYTVMKQIRVIFWLGSTTCTEQNTTGTYTKHKILGTALYDEEKYGR